MALEPAKLSDFTIAGALGSGTTARVYEAVHTATGRPVAIKMMEQSSSTSEMRERFAREALLLSGVDSRHVAKILGFGFGKGQPFLVLERLHGETLDAKLRRDGPVPALVAVRWIEQLIVGVRDCHDAKIIHRDIKPSNIFLHHDGFDEMVKVIDFGVARLRELTGDTGGLTSANHLIGSMGYMAPEQFKGAKSVSYSADLYAIGVVIFRALTGRLPFVSRSVETILRMKSEQAAPTIASMGGTANPELEWFVQKALLREPEGRFQSAREMLEQWWNVASSFEQGRKTDVGGGVDESFVETLQPPTVAPTTEPLSKGFTSVSSVRGAPVSSDDRTIRRPPALPSAHSENMRPAVSAVSPPASWRADRTIEEVLGPHTEPTHALRTQDPYEEGEDRMVDSGNDRTAINHPRVEEDPFELPTRNDPNLRKLVEQELELQKARRRGK